MGKIGEEFTDVVEYLKSEVEVEVLQVFGGDIGARV